MTTSNTTPGITLNPEQKKTLKKAAKNSGGLNTKRAKALLEVAKGKSQVEAAAKSGLTAGQVRYSLAKAAE